MGTCLGKNNKNKKQSYTKSLENQPQDTQLYNPKLNNDIQLLKFQAILANVKIEGDIQEQLGLSFIISDRVLKAEFPFSSPTGDQKKIIKWKIKEEIFTITLSQYDIRKKRLQIRINTKSNQVIQQININLYQILTGPIKNNFKITSQEGMHIHLLFDLKISQVLKPQIKVIKTELSLKNQFPGQKFNFTLELILSQNGRNSRKISSRPSSTYQMPLNQQAILVQLQDDPGQPVNIDWSLSRKKTLKASRCEYAILSWDQTQNLPEINFNITAQQISSSLFMFHCWRISNTQPKSKEVMHRFANFRMTLHELLEEQSLMISSNNLVLQNQNLNGKNVVIEQQLWSNGVIIGHSRNEIQIKIPKYVKQLQGWTRTQRGTVNILLGQFGTDDQTVYLKSFQKIINLHQKLLLIKLKLATKIESYFKRKQIYEEGEKIIIQISNHLQDIDMEGTSTYSIDKMKQICDKQLTLLQIMNTVFSLLKEQNNTFIEECWRLLIIFIKRGQFQLKRIGFTKQQLVQIPLCFSSVCHQIKGCKHPGKQKYHGLLKKKVKIALQFQKLLFNCLIISLTNVPYFNEGDNTVENCQSFKAYCFLRIPLFRQFVLKSIQRQDDLDYSQFQIKQRQWLKSRVQIKQKQMELVKQLQWDDYFYKVISFHPQSKEIYEELQETLQNCVWVDEIQNRETLFFVFFKLVMVELQKIQIKLKIPKYQYFSGYNKLVTAFLNQMKSIQLKKYPISLIKSSLVLLHNQELYEPILLLIAKKTNYYDTNLVVKCLSLYKFYVNYLTQSKKNLPLSFCYGTFIKVIKKILQSDSVYCVAAMLMLIYECYDKFEMQFQSYLTIYFLGSKFIPLFYHWSYLVRSIFHHFFILKIAQNRRIFFNSDLKIHTKLYMTYERVLDQLEQIKKANHIFDSDRLRQMQHDKEYHLKMKHKLWKRKNKQLTQQQKQLQWLQENMSRKYYSMDKVQILPETLDQVNTSIPALQNESIRSMIFDYKKKQELVYLTPKKMDSLIMIRTKTLVPEEEFPLQIPLLHATNKQYTYHQSAKYHGAFRQQEFVLREFTSVEKNQIQTAHRQFDRINKEITNKFIQTQQLPHIPLANQVKLDEHDLKPEDIQFSNF